MTHRSPDLRGATAESTGVNEIGRQYANDCVRVGIEPDGLACDRRICSEAALPKTVGEDGCGFGSSPVVISGEVTTKYGPDT